ncbi:MAG: hypothetical protein J6333_08645, partial [Planctomycetes bacterium]|nr:hypothetical protein [Planctomycetota bacterium]
MERKATGSFTELDGETFYKIADYDRMEDFFMTIASPTDVWNFCWSQGGVTAGRVNADFAFFPYYTADKVADAKTCTGHYAAVAVRGADGKTAIWEPFAPLLCNTGARWADDPQIARNLYKNANGSKVWFEEVNQGLGLTFRYGWASSAAFGLVRMAVVADISGKAREVTVLDGCRNIMPACTDAKFQNDNSVLLDAYKQSDIDARANLALFAVSSVVTDKAEPSEGLLANVSWFTVPGPLFLAPDTPARFFAANGDAAALRPGGRVKGERPSCFIVRQVTLAANGSEAWEQVFDAALSAPQVAALEERLADRPAARRALLDDIAAGEELMNRYLRESDGVQRTNAAMTATHHRANVMFNIMRGGFFVNDGRVDAPDFLAFVKSRDAAKLAPAQAALGELAGQTGLAKDAVMAKMAAASDPQLTRLALEYMPLTFSRRHGDPSRPWNRFNIRLLDADKKP